MNDTLVSVVIPVCDGARYLGEAIESALGQKGPAVEVIVIDDGSRDGSAALARSYAPRVVCRSRPESHGAGAARNLGVALARGDYVAFLDSDDVWVQGKLMRQVAAMHAEPRPDLAFGAVSHFVSPDLDPDSAARVYCPEGLQRGYFPSSLMARRDAFERVGPFREDLRIGEAIDWLARAREHGLREVMLPDHVVSRRLHDANLGVRYRDDRRDLVRVIKASLDRRRAAVGETP